jgi:hypothetical protein
MLTIEGVLSVAVHVQPLEAVTVTVSLYEAAAIDTLVGERLYVQATALTVWLTVFDTLLALLLSPE